jgi:putative ABC transport system permease protein
MVQWIKIALRNIMKNRRRSVVTILAVAVGFAAVGLFRGYTANTYEGLRQSAIRGEGLGHLTIYKAGWSTDTGEDPHHFMFSPKEIQEVMKIAKTDPSVLLATPQLHVSGLVSNGRTSKIFLAKGVVPADHRSIAGSMADLRPVQGKGLNDQQPSDALMSMDLGHTLGLTPGSDAVVMATTVEGQMNALDIHVNGLYDTGSDATNDKYLLLSFAHAQNLYDTDRADRMVVLLNHWRHTQKVQKWLAGQFAATGLVYEIKTWEELSLFYGKVKSMFDMIFFFIFLIVLVIVVMSTVNTMGMTVVERTREIGTLRVLGVKRLSITWLFAVEGALLGVLGSLSGILLNLIVWAGVRMAGPSYIPPGVSSPVPLVVDLLPAAMAGQTLYLTLLCMGAAIWPASRAARLDMVEALGHV